MPSASVDRCNIGAGSKSRIENQPDAPNPNEGFALMQSVLACHVLRWCRLLRVYNVSGTTPLWAQPIPQKGVCWLNMGLMNLFCEAYGILDAQGPICGYIHEMLVSNRTQPKMARLELLVYIMVVFMDLAIFPLSNFLSEGFLQLRNQQDNWLSFGLAEHLGSTLVLIKLVYLPGSGKSKYYIKFQ